MTAVIVMERTSGLNIRNEWSSISSYSILDEFKKFAILKKGIGIESQNLCKQFNDQKTMQTRWNSTVGIEQKVDSKAFAIPILTARL